MKRSSKRGGWWILFAVCSSAVLAALAWVSVRVLELERSEFEARTQMDHQSKLRLALWRMDSWLAPHIATEAARAPLEYESFVPAIAGSGGEPYSTPSPLIGFRSEFIRLHFQVRLGQEVAGNSQQMDTGTVAADEQHTVTPMEVANANNADFLSCAVSPQVAACTPESVLSQSGWTSSELDSNDQTLAWINQTLDLPTALAQIRRAEATVLAGSSPGDVPAPPIASPASSKSYGMAPDDEQETRGQNQRELSKRLQLAQEFQNVQQERGESNFAFAPPAPGTHAGPLLPVWVGAKTPVPGSGNHALFFLRRATLDGREYLQGFLVEWPALARCLLNEVADLFSEARLAPVIDDVARAAEDGNLLAGAPVALAVAPLPVASAGALTPARITLLVTWIAALVALAASAFTLRATLAFGEKRSRFASAVTHELRTPLTTFRMYSEMLAEGMVSEPGARQEYLETLRRESARLSALVENVLAYARVEEGRRPAAREEIALAALWARVVGPLARRATEAGMRLHVDLGAAAGTKLSADVDAVGQILFNLVDNACKYGRSETDPLAAIEVTSRGRHVEIRVRDHGPGVPAAAARAIFDPFDRAGREASATPGVGLGLALSRELARAMGGTLILEPTAAPGTTGATFVLTLPVSDR